MLGYEVERGDYKGSSLLGQLPEDRTLLVSCWNDSGCLASIKGTEKYVYHFDDEPEELFDLSADPTESRNLVPERPEDTERRRQELLGWRAKVSAEYGAQPSG